MYPSLKHSSGQQAAGGGGDRSREEIHSSLSHVGGSLRTSRAISSSSCVRQVPSSGPPTHAHHSYSFLIYFSSTYTLFCATLLLLLLYSYSTSTFSYPEDGLMQTEYEKKYRLDGPAKIMLLWTWVVMLMDACVSWKMGHIFCL